MTDTSWTDDLLAGVREIDAAAEGYEDAEDYFTGDVPEVFAAPAVRRKLAATGERYKFALASTPVKVLADRVVLTGVSTGRPQLDQIVSAVRTTNRMQLLEPNVHLSTFKFGDAYLFSWPDLTPDGRVVGVRVLLNEPATVRAVYGEDDPNAILYVIKAWVERSADGTKRRRADVYYDATEDDAGRPVRARIERFVTKDGSGPRGHQSGDWQQFLDDGQEEWLIEHDFGLPWTHFRNGAPYGTPEHALAYGPQDAITKLLITQITTTDHHGWPQRYGLIDPAAVLDQNESDPDWGDDLDADDDSTAEGGVSSGERDGPGTMKKFTGMREVGQFATADPDVFIQPVDLYVRLMSQLTGTPLYDFDPSKDQPSGVARRRAEAPLIAKIGNRELYLSDTWAQFWGRVFELLDVEDAPEVAVSWRPAFVIDDTEGLDVLAAKRALGVPVEELLVEAGYTREQASAWAENAEPLPGSLLGSLG